MKTLSLWQPWASLWLSPMKVHETRHWKTPYRGELAVHAAKRPIDARLPAELVELCEDQFGGHWRMDLPLGAILGVVQLVDCLSTNIHGPADPSDFLCGNFGPDRWLWKRGEYHVLARPLSIKGHQALWNGPDGILGVG